MALRLIQRPESFTALTRLTFDYVVTMLDESIPLTGEFEEWGIAGSQYQYMKATPRMTTSSTGLSAFTGNDRFTRFQVQYWERQKWVSNPRAENR